jgi:hypothetical protein
MITRSLSSKSEPQSRTQTSPECYGIRDQLVPGGSSIFHLQLHPDPGTTVEIVAEHVEAIGSCGSLRESCERFTRGRSSSLGDFHFEWRYRDLHLLHTAHLRSSLLAAINCQLPLPNFAPLFAIPTFAYHISYIMDLCAVCCVLRAMPGVFRDL